MDFSKFNYDCEGQISLFDLTRETFKIRKPIRLIELFGGIGSQAMALKRLGADFEHYRLVEFDPKPVKSYNAIHGTEFEPTDITKIHGSDLGIVDTDKYCYIMTYSFPCQDLSIAGLQKGMAKGSGTRSGLLWEVERLLNEVDTLPQVLLMENVTQVHSEGDNKRNFQAWLDFLEKKGYSNFVEDLNARNYGVPQNRERCFCVSILGEWNYKFPMPIPLKRDARDLLEPNVDESYRMSGERVQKLLDELIVSGSILTDRQTDRQLIDSSIKNPRVKHVANAILAGNKGIVNHQAEGNAVLETYKHL